VWSPVTLCSLPESALLSVVAGPLEFALGVSSAVYSDSRFEDVDSSPGGFSSGVRRHTSSRIKVSHPCRRIILANRVTSQTDRQSKCQDYPASCCTATGSSVTSVSW
jgi:hypothetical protein